MRKLSARVTLGRTSPFGSVLLSRLLNRGKVRVGLAVAFHERKNGGLVATPGGPPAPRSNSSQLYVSPSPLASVAEPVSTKGVFAGIVKPPAGTDGTGIE